LKKAYPLLRNGVEFCEMIERGNLVTSNEVINQSQLDDYEVFQVLVRCVSPEELKCIVDEADKVKKNLLKMINGKAIFSEKSIREMQYFFNKTGGIYLAVAARSMR